MKKIFKILSILIIIILVFALLFFIFIKANLRSKQVVVLSYHNIVPDDILISENEYDTMHLSDFKKQMDYLKENGYVTISAKELYNWKENNINIPEKAVLITFDDGYTSFKQLVQPVLEEYNFKAICFIIGNQTTNTTPEYNPNEYQLLGLDEILNHIDNVEYGSHTYGLHMLSSNGIQYVKLLSKEDLQIDTDNFNNNIFKAEYLAYPYYTYTEDYIEILKKNGYKLAFAGEEEMATKGVNSYKIPRISGAKNFDEFKEIFETNKYKNKYGNGLIRKICVNIERKIKK